MEVTSDILSNVTLGPMPFFRLYFLLSFPEGSFSVEFGRLHFVGATFRRFESDFTPPSV